MERRDRSDDDIPDYTDLPRSGPVKTQPIPHETDLMACPFCARAVRHDADVCHHCRNFILRETPRNPPNWGLLLWLLIAMFFAATALKLVGVLEWTG